MGLKIALLPCLLVLTAACSSTTPEKPAASSKPTETATDGASDNFSSPLSVSIAVNGVLPGEENTKCLQVRLGNAAAVEIGKVHNTLSAESHHLIVSAITDPTQTEEPLVDCAPFRAVLIGAPLTVTQRADDLIVMPKNVAFPLDAKQLMHLELHYINTSTKTVDIVAQSNLYPIAAPGPDIQEASFLVIGTLNIAIPPMSQYEKPWSYVQLPEEFADVNIYGATGHTHRFGTAARLAIAGDDGGSPNVIYDPQPFTWDEATLKFFDPPLRVPSGGGFSFQCAWDNPTTAAVNYGESALDEMCFFWTYYYPRGQGNRVLLAGFPPSTSAQKDAGGSDAAARSGADAQ